MAEGLIAAVVISLARTWDTKLPGFRDEFRTQMDAMYLLTPASQVALRVELEQISLALREG
jgi:hypothetical protein